MLITYSSVSIGLRSRNRKIPVSSQQDILWRPAACDAFKDVLRHDLPFLRCPTFPADSPGGSCVGASTHILSRPPCPTLAPSLGAKCGTISRVRAMYIGAVFIVSRRETSVRTGYPSHCYRPRKTQHSAAPHFRLPAVNAWAPLQGGAITFVLVSSIVFFKTAW